MGKYPLSATDMTSARDSLQFKIAASLQLFDAISRLLFRNAETALGVIHSFVSSTPEKIADLANAWNERRRATAPLLQFPDSAAVGTRNAEPDDRAIFASRRNTVVQQALQMENLQARAGRSLDAADYALLRMRLELAEIAPSLVTELPDLLVEHGHALSRPRVAARSLRGTAPGHRNFAA